MHNEKSSKLLKADLFMAIELFNDLIATGGLSDLSERICIQLRELSGARTVMLIKHDDSQHMHSLSGISPRRRAGLFSNDELSLLCPDVCSENVVITPETAKNPDLKELMLRVQAASLLRFPLQIDKRTIGLIILIDLPDINRIVEIIEILYFLSTSMALTVRNALDRDLINQQTERLRLLNEGLEEKVHERTRDLEEVNRLLLTEIDQRKKAQAELQKSEELHRSLFEASSEGIIVADTETMQISYANPAASQMFGYQTDELCRLLITSLHPADSLELIKRDFLARVADEKHYSSSVPCEKKDGSRFIADIQASKVYFNGKLHLVGFFTDVTRRNQEEESRQRSARLDALGLLAGGIAHDFNNLLAGIYGFIELSLDGIYDASALNNLTTALSTIDRAKALTHQLLTFSKGGSPAKRSEHLFPMVKETALFGLSGSNLTCAFNIADDLWPCHMDRNQISQVIDNLVINARQAMQNGGHLEISAENYLAKKSAGSDLEPGRYVRLAIHDNGPGVDSENLKKIFDPFFTTKEMGNGLGLAVCYSIMRKHGGSIEAESLPGQGATFTLFLPAAELQQTVVEEAVKSLQVQGGTVLIMDDEEVVRNILALMLENLGYQVILTTSGEEVLQLFDANSECLEDITAMIFDLTIPGGIGGKELCVKVKSRGIDIPLIVTSGYAEDPVMADPGKFGFIGRLKKPFTLSDLAKILGQPFVKTI